MPRNMAPANVSSPRDLVDYKISDASPVDASAPGGYIERYIHSEIYKKFPAVNSVIHSHANAVIPYSITGMRFCQPQCPSQFCSVAADCLLGVPMKPCLHVAGFLGMKKTPQLCAAQVALSGVLTPLHSYFTGTSTPVYDISEHYQSDDTRDLLIRNTSLGNSLASCFASSHLSSSSSHHEPNHSVVLMRGHGYTIVAPTIEECIFRAIYTKENAIILTTSLGLRLAYQGSDGSVADIQYLHDDEITDSSAISQNTWSRAWGLWLREVEVSHLYVNETRKVLT